MKLVRALVLIPLLSCAEPATPARPEVIPLTIASASASASATDASAIIAPTPTPRSARSVVGYPEPVDPAAGGCVLKGDWERAQPRTLSFRPQGKPFATAHQTRRAELALPAKTEAGALRAFAELASDKVRVWGYVDGAAVILHAARAFLVAGYAAPGAELPLKWLGSNDTRVTIGIDPPPALVPREPIVGERPCEDLTLTRSTFAARDAVTEPTIAHGELVTGKRIALGVEPGGAPVAHLTFETSDAPNVDVVAKSGKQTRVVLSHVALNPALRLLVVGWVDTSLVTPAQHGTGGSWGGSGLRAWSGGHSPRRITCDHALPFAAEQDGETHLVGVVAPNVPIGIFLDPGEDVNVLLSQPQIEPAEGARLFVKREAIASCSEVK